MLRARTFIHSHSENPGNVLIFSEYIFAVFPFHLDPMACLFLQFRMLGIGTTTAFSKNTVDEGKWKNGNISLLDYLIEVYYHRPPYTAFELDIRK